MKDGTHQKQSLKPNPDNESKLQRASVAYLKTHNKVGDHKGGDKVLGDSPTSSQAGGLRSAMTAAFMPRTSMYALPAANAALFERVRHD